MRVRRREVKGEIERSRKGDGDSERDREREKNIKGIHV